MAQANVVYMDDMRSASDALFQPPSVETRRYLENQINSYVNNVQMTGSNFGQSILEKYNQIMNTDTIRQLEYIRNRTTALFIANDIQPIITVADIQQASEQMQRWILANPTVGQMYQSGAISGYLGSYEKPRLSGIGIHNSDYRRVTDGVIISNGETSISRSYIELVEPNDVLSVTNKYAIMKTWAAIEEHLNSEEDDKSDPTSVWDDHL